MEEWKCYGVELKKKGDDVSHASLDEISHSKKTDQNKEAGAQWAYWKKIINGSKHPFLPHFSNLCHNPYPQILYFFDSLMCLCLSHTHDIICFWLRA